MRAEEIKGLMEAYSKVHETPEVLSEEVIELSDEDLNGVELIEMTFEELEMLDEQGGNTDPRGYGARQARIKGQTQVKTALGQGKGIGLQSASGLGQGTKPGQKAFGTQLGGRQGVVVKGGASGPNYGPRGGSSFTRAADTVNVGGQTLYKAKKGNDIVYLQGKNKPQLFKSGQKPNTGSGGSGSAGSGSGGSGSGGSGRGAGSGVTPRPAATSTPKPTATPTPAKPAGSAMDQWAAANPKLAAAKAERDRTRGTSATTNPLMKDMKSSLPAPKSPAPSTAKTGFDLAKKGVNLAAGVDIFDLVKGHLLDEGYAETEENALVMMANMSEEWRESIIMGLTEAEIMKHQKERDRIEANKKRFAKSKTMSYEPPTKGKHGEIERRMAKRPPSRLRSGSLPEELETEGYQRDPEKGEKEDRKYEKVRGEKTPMPPRGDKRREDFEKWYRANVR
jgi:hypothetical protein